MISGHLAHELLDDCVEHLCGEGVLAPDAQRLVEALNRPHQVPRQALGGER